MYVDPKTGEAIPAPVESAHDPVRTALEALAQLFLPVFEALFRDRLVAVLTQPVDPATYEPEGVRMLVKTRYLLDSLDADEARRDRATRAFEAGEGGLKAFMEEIPAADVEAESAVIQQELTHPTPPTDDEIRKHLFDHAWHVVRAWANALIDAARPTKVAMVDERMLPVVAADARRREPNAWLRSKHPDPLVGSFIIEAEEMREVFRRVKAAHAADRPLPLAIEPLLSRFAVTAVNAPA